MNYNIVINSLKTVNDIENSWSNSDVIALLKAFDFYDETITSDSELKYLLFLAITDLEPSEAAEIILSHILGSKLNEGQIANISHEMLEDKISEEYADISLHYDFFKINQLLYSAFNGTFPNIKATIIEFEMKLIDGSDKKITKEIIVKAFQGALAKNNLIDRLFHDEIIGKIAFDDANSIIWELHELGNHTYKIITSDYWMCKDDFELSEFEIDVKEFEED